MVVGYMLKVVWVTLILIIAYVLLRFYSNGDDKQDGLVRGYIINNLYITTRVLGI